MNIDGAIAAKVVNHFTNKMNPSSAFMIHLLSEQFKEELVQVMNEKAE